MILKLTFQIARLIQWDDEIYAAAMIFIYQFGLCPNIFRANTPTLNRIDMVADRSKVHNTTKPVPEFGYIPIEGFTTENQFFDLAFYVNESLKDGQFELIFDDDPESDEQVPEQDSITLTVWKCQVLGGHSLSVSK